MAHSQIEEHMPVIGSDDRVEGDRITLAKNDPTSGGSHHYISMDQVESVEDGEVHLMISAAEARSSPMAEQ